MVVTEVQFFCSQTAKKKGGRRGLVVNASAWRSGGLLLKSRLITIFGVKTHELIEFKIAHFLRIRDLTT